MEDVSQKDSREGNGRPYALTVLLGSWIPPFGILFGLFAYASSWIILLFAGVETTPTTGIPFGFELAWIHTLTIGFFTMIAISMLFHVLPAFTGLPVVNEKAARSTLPFLGLGAIGIVGFFLDRGTRDWAWGFPMGAFAILAWTALFFASLWRGVVQRPALGLRIIFFLLPAGFLLATALFGLWAGTDLVFPPFPDWVVPRVIPAHLSMGLLGWLTLLIWIVTASTHRPILGVAADFPLLVPLASGALAVGLACVVAGRLADLHSIYIVGAVILLLSVLLYLGWSVVLLRKAHPSPPILKVWWITAVSGLGISLFAWAGHLLWGVRLDLGVFVFMTVWLMPILLGHLHLIGVRLLATLVLGPEDQTPPRRILKPSYSWAFWGTSLGGSLTGLLGVSLSNGKVLVIAGGLGCVSAGLLLLHILAMVRALKALARTAPPPPAFIRISR